MILNPAQPRLLRDRHCRRTWAASAEVADAELVSFGSASDTGRRGPRRGFRGHRRLVRAAAHDAARRARATSRFAAGLGFSARRASAQPGDPLTVADFAGIVRTAARPPAATVRSS